MSPCLNLAVRSEASLCSAGPSGLFCLLSELSRSLLFIPISRDHPFPEGPLIWVGPNPVRNENAPATWSVAMIINHCGGERGSSWQRNFSSLVRAYLSQQLLLKPLTVSLLYVGYISIHLIIQTFEEFHWKSLKAPFSVYLIKLCYRSGVLLSQSCITFIRR